MDYKKKYENALEWARQVINGECGFIRKEVEEVFPELKKSEDEKIRKDVLAFIRREGQHIDKYKWHKWIAWLEKQGKYETIWKPTKEQLEALEHFVRSVGESGYASPYDNNTKLLYSLLTDLQALEKQDSSKVKPKFKSGQWIVNKGHSYLIAAIEDDRYLFEIGGYTHEQLNWEYIENADNNYHLWTIQDAKDGDVLYSPCLGLLWIFKSRDTVYCGCNLNYNDGAFFGEGYFERPTEAIPATKIQRDILFQKMKQAGWSWNPETKELSQSKVTKKSDQDGMSTDIAIKALNYNTVNDSYCKENCKGYQETGKCYADWDCEAKRKAEQNLVWSEEDEEQVSIITNIVQAHCGKLIDCRANLKWLKSLKERLSL